MDKFSHDGHDDLFWFFTVFLEAISELFEEEIEHSGVHGGHEEGAS